MSLRWLRAAWVLPIDRPPLRDGAVLVDARGRIAAVGPAAELSPPPGAAVTRLPDAALLPGLVNAHTHLELTGLAPLGEVASFADWIRGIIERKRARTPAGFLDAARQGLRDCWAAGVTTVADCGDSGAVAAALAELGGSGIAYHEVFGPHPAQVDESMAGLAARVAELRRVCEGPRVRIGVSPHAPYSVSGPLYRASARWAREAGLPLAVHLAESAEESALLAEGRGAFAEMWARRGIPPLPPAGPAGRSPAGWLEEHGVLGPDCLCIHVVRADAADVARLARAGAAVAHCPLSNAAHAHGAAPLAELRSAGLRVGLGTDSVASVGRLDLLAEARAARRLGALSAGEALELCTLGGARALGLCAEIGSLAPGKWGDVAAVRLPRAAARGGDAGAVTEAVLATTPDDVVLTLLGGRVVHEARAIRGEPSTA
jgi:5-methylthioadenosine/S-adenosylhomocysteine deaminase